MKQKQIILFVGLPGSGKTTLADALRDRVGGARVNADAIRATISVDLQFSVEDRRVQAGRMGALSALAIMPPPAISVYSEEFLNRLNSHVITDFVCPTPEMMTEFQFAARLYYRDVAIRTVFMDTIRPSQSRFPDTAKLFVPPTNPDVVFTMWMDEEAIHSASLLLARTFNLGFNLKEL